MTTNTKETILETSVHDTRDLDRLAEELADQWIAGSLVVLSGDLGAGKTTFVQSFCRALGIKAEVTSPTFTIINEYSGTVPVYHFDFYRLKHVSEVKGLNIDDYLFGDGICLMEWGEKIEDILPVPHYHMTITIISDNERNIKIEEHK
ncbi:MAG: hypothetical protein Kow00108_22440 [Calditrichia bacterium]